MEFNTDQFLQIFFVECRDLRQEMEDILLSLENAPEDPEILNALFRAAHTIKGSAGLFGLERFVAFTHVMESLLDQVRDGKVPIDRDLIAVLLACADHIGHLVNVMEASGEEGGETERSRESELTARMMGYLEWQDPGPAVPAAAEPARAGGVESDNWHLSLRFGRDVFRNGMDPASFIRYLATIGDILSLTPLWEAMPGAEEMEAESCYLGLEISLKSHADKETIEGVFEFVREDSVIRILPPHSQLESYLAIIEDMPESDRRLGDILVQCGSLTPRELEEALALQQVPKTPLGEILIEQQLVSQPVVEAALKKQTEARNSKIQDSKVIRVDAEKLDRLINLIGELVIAGSGANLLAHKSGMSELHAVISVFSRLVEEVRDSALNLRMVEIGITFNRFQRVVRDVSQELGKEIDLVIRGADTELDKSVVEKIADPLTHLVRNAIDHGIERREKRLQTGKPARGVVRLNAYHDSGNIVIEVSDDGGGLNRQKILAKAVERGLVPASQALSDYEIDNLIFEPGFSTAEQVTNLSGRGVGMDVVKQQISALRGTIDLESQEGAGSMVRIRLPLTLAIIDGFLVGVGRSSFVIPLDMVVECVELTDRQASHERDYLNLRSEVLPLIRLRDMFKIQERTGQRENVVVIQYGLSRLGVVVDELKGEFQTVIKPLGQIFSRLKGIAGSTVLGTGEVSLILDVPALAQAAMNAERHSWQTL